MWTSNGPSASLWGLLCCSNRLLWMPRTGRWKVSLASIDVVSSKISSPWLWTPKSWKIPRLCVSSNSSSQVASLQSLHLNLSPSLISDLLPGNWWISGKGGATWKGWLCMLPTTDPRLNWWRQHYDTKLPRNTTTNLEASVQMKCSISSMITICGFGRTPSITESAQMGTSFGFKFSPKNLCLSWKKKSWFIRFAILLVGHSRQVRVKLCIVSWITFEGADVPYHRMRSGGWSSSLWACSETCKSGWLAMLRQECTM